MANSIIDGTSADSLKMGTIVLLLKDERRYRPVCLLEALYRATMTRMSDRMLDLFQEFDLLDEDQHAFVRDGSTAAPLDILNAAMERSLGTNSPLHLVLLDATSAYDCVELSMLDVALRRLGAPEDFIDWVRSNTDGHTRMVRATSGLTPAESAFGLGGLPQGDPFSCCTWLCVADMALCHAKQAAGDGFLLAEPGEVHDRADAIYLKKQGYADDCLAAANNNREATRTAQAR